MTRRKVKDTIFVVFWYYSRLKLFFFDTEFFKGSIYFEFVHNYTDNTYNYNAYKHIAILIKYWIGLLSIHFFYLFGLNIE